MLVDSPGHRRLDDPLLLGIPEVRQQQAHRQQAGEGVGGPLAGDVRRRAVDRLEHRHPPRLEAVDVGAGRHPQPPLERRPQVGDDVAEEVVGDDHPELGGILDQVQAQRVHVDVLPLDRRGVLPGHLVEHPQPQLVGVAHGVRLVRHVHHRVPVAPRVLEGRPDDPLDALAGVDVLVDRHLVRGTPLELPPHPHVDPLGGLPEHHEIHVPRPPPLQRHEPIRQRAARPHVGEKVVPLAHPEEDVPGMLHPGNPRIPQRPQQHRRALPLDRHAHLRRERRPIPQVALRSQIQLPEIQREPALLPHKLQ